MKYFLDLNHVDNEVNATTLIELKGIKIAANKGDISPRTAAVKPTTLYRKLIPNVNFTMIIASFVSAK